MSPLPSVPPDTHSWAEAVAEGYYGQRTDPLPDDYYKVTGGPGTLKPALTSVTPATQAASIDGAWTLAVKGTFPIADKLEWRVVIVNMDGTEWESLDLTDISLTDLTAHYLNGPDYPAAAPGAATVVLRYGETDAAPGLPFEWTA
jgi:hypothetical protein